MAVPVTKLSPGPPFNDDTQTQTDTLTRRKHYQPTLVIKSIIKEIVANIQENQLITRSRSSTALSLGSASEALIQS